jgi:NAD+ synthase (glutamine-hydrolysing)
MSIIKPIKDLRDTSNISKEAHKCHEPIFITKNGHQDLVLMSDECFNNQNQIKEADASISESNACLGFVRAEACTINISIGDIASNIERIKNKIEEAEKLKVALLVFHELCLTGYTCGDLFLNQDLRDKTIEGILELKKFSFDRHIVFIFGAPIIKSNSLYNCAIIIYNGKILGIVPKSFIPNYNEFYEARYFAPCPDSLSEIAIGNEKIPFGTNLIFYDLSYKKFSFAVEICEDLWTVDTPSSRHVQKGAAIIANLSASDEIVGKAEYRRNLVKMTSSRLCAAYIYSCAGQGESTQDLVYPGHNIIAENGHILKETELFADDNAIADIDLDRIINYRIRMTTYKTIFNNNYMNIGFDLQLNEPDHLLRRVSPTPFIPEKESELKERADLILKMQAEGLIQRMKHINVKKVVVGLSGGLDSTLALLATYTAFTILKYPFRNITAFTLPSFGTTDLTHSNAYKLAKALGCTFKDVNINSSIKQHFSDIGHDMSNHNTTYENSQARERTQILMDYANDHDAIMIGTGDLSELCLGWTTYSGDHMSMYNLNSGVPKTLVKFVVKQFAEENPKMKDVLLSILDTPISPELIPSIKGEIQQKTEDIVGPYELNDFFIFYFLRHNFSVRKIYYMTNIAFKGKYAPDVIKKWLTLFIKRFFSAQFKRSCLPDGMKIGSVAISPRGDLRMPSDASYHMYLKECEDL